MSEPDYGTVAEVLRKAGSSCGAAEAHGGLCGSLCAAGPEGGAALAGRLCAGRAGAADAAPCMVRRHVASLERR